MTPLGQAAYRVLITDKGRSGEVVYLEGPLRLPLWWEFTTDGAWVWAPPPDQWDAHWSGHGMPGAVGRRREVLERVAGECVRQRAASATFEVDHTGIILRFGGLRHP